MTVSSLQSTDHSFVAGQSLESSDKPSGARQESSSSISREAGPLSALTPRTGAPAPGRRDNRIDLGSGRLKITPEIVAGGPRESGAAQSVSASSRMTYIPRSEDGKLQFDDATTVTGTRKGNTFAVYDGHDDHRPVGELSIFKHGDGEAATDAVPTPGGRPRSSHSSHNHASSSSAGPSSAPAVYGRRPEIQSYGNRNHETLAAYTLGRYAVERPVPPEEFEMLLHAVENNAMVRYLYMQYGFGDVGLDRVNSQNASLTRTIAVQQVLDRHAELTDPERAALIRFAGAGNCKQQAELTMATYGANVGPGDRLHLVVNSFVGHTYVIHQGGGTRQGINVMVDAWSPIGALNTADAAVVDFDIPLERNLPLTTPLSQRGTFIYQTYNRATALQRYQEFNEACENPSPNLRNAMNEFNQVLPDIHQRWGGSDYAAGTQSNANVVTTFADEVRQRVDAIPDATKRDLVLGELRKISPNATSDNVISTLQRALFLDMDEMADGSVAIS